MMRTVTLVVAVVFAAALICTAVIAGDYHRGETLICSDCHIMHYSLQHDYDGGNPEVLDGSGPHEYLLKADVNSLCLTCHDGSTGAPDVRNANTNAYVRQAGALNDQTDATYQHWMGHTLGSTANAPGYDGSYISTQHGLSCMDCHHPHGHAGSSAKDGAGNTVTNAWRNLRAKSYGGVNYNVSYASGTNDLTKDIFQTSNTLGQLSTHYATTNMNLNKPSSTGSGVSNWCRGCHTNFHSNSGISADGLEQYLRHPTAGAVVGALGGGHSRLNNYTGKTNKIKVMSSTGVWDSSATDITPTCLSCHKGHGNQNAFGLIHMSGTGTVTEQGDSDGTMVKHLCKQCHGQG